MALGLLGSRLFPKGVEKWVKFYGHAQMKPDFENYPVALSG